MSQRMVAQCDIPGRKNRHSWLTLRACPTLRRSSLSRVKYCREHDEKNAKHSIDKTAKSSSTRRTRHLPGLFNQRPDSRYGESERSELGFFIRNAPVQ